MSAIPGRRRHVRTFLAVLMTACFAHLYAPASAAANPPQFVAHELPPLIFNRQGEVVGMAADVVRELQRRTGIGAPFVMMPFSRAYMTVSSTPNTALVFLTRTQERDQLFQWVGPLANVSTSIYAPKGSTVTITGLDDAKRAPSLIVHHGSHLDQSFKRMGFSNLRPANSIGDAIRTLLLPGNEHMLVALTTVTVPDTLNHLGLAADAIVPVYTISKLQGYLAFSKGTPPETVDSFQKALDDMKRDGTFASIHAKWLPHEKPPGFKPEPVMDVP